MPASIFPAFALGNLQNFALTGGKKRTMIERFTLASDAAGTYPIGVPLRAGIVPIRFFLTATVSLGTTQIAIGIAGATGKYRAAAVFTAVETPTPFGLVAACGIPLAAAEQLLMTTTVAALPASGTLMIDLEYADNS